MRQAGTGRASASESLLTCRNPKTTSELGCFGCSGPAVFTAVMKKCNHNNMVAAVHDGAVPSPAYST
jgi:hypothetical protein